MSIYHLSVKIGSRSKGQSAVAASAYRSGIRMVNEETGKVSDFTKKDGVVYSEVFLCANAPEAYKNREALWNAVHKVEKSKDAQLWREIEVALPIEMTREKQIEAVQEFVKGLTDKGMCADWSLHDTGSGNPHAHIMLTMRAIREDGTWASKCRSEYILDENWERQPLIDPKTNKQKVDKQNRKKWKTRRVSTMDWDDPERIEEWRTAWETVCNKRLALENHIDHRSYAEQQKGIEPTIHEGYVAREMEKRGEKSDRCRINRDIERNNRILRKESYSVPKLADEIKAQEEMLDVLQKKLSLYQAGVEQYPTIVESLGQYLKLKPVYDVLQELDKDKKKEKYEKKHAEEFDAFQKVQNVLIAFYGDDIESFPSDAEEVQRLQEIFEQGIKETESEIAKAEETLLHLKRKKTVCVQLETQYAEILADNFRHSGCWYKQNENEAGSTVSFDRTDAKTLRVLQDTFPKTDFPFDKWEIQAEKCGFEDPLMVQVQITAHDASSVLLEEYIRNGQSGQVIREFQSDTMRQFFGIKETIEELLPHVRLVLIDTDSKEIQESQALLHWAEIENMKAVSNALNLLVQNGIKNMEMLSRKCAYVSDSADKMKNYLVEIKEHIEELDKHMALIRQYWKNKPFYDEWKNSSFPNWYKKNHADEIQKYQAANVALRKMYSGKKLKLPKRKELQAKREEWIQKSESASVECQRAEEEKKEWESVRTSMSSFAKQHQLFIAPIVKDYPFPDEQKECITLSAEGAIILQKNFALRGCACVLEPIDKELCQVFFDKTDAMTLRTLYDSMPRAVFPYDEWAAQAAAMGKEDTNPLRGEETVPETFHFRNEDLFAIEESLRSTQKEQVNTERSYKQKEDMEL